MGIKQEVWVGWLAAVAVSAVAGTFVAITFAYAQFETKEHAREKQDASERRLERIEDKLDAVIEHRPYRGPNHD